MFQMYGGRGNYDSDNIKKLNVIVICISIGSIIYSGFLIDNYIKKKNHSQYRDYGISLIVIPVISILFLLLGYFKGDGFVMTALCITIVNLVLFFVSLGNLANLPNKTIL